MAGSVVGGYYGGLAAVSVCNAVFAIPSVGTSLLWCGIIAGGLSGYLGSNLASSVGESRGEEIYKALIKIRDN